MVGPAVAASIRRSHPSRRTGRRAVTAADILASATAAIDQVVPARIPAAALGVITAGGERAVHAAGLTHREPDAEPARRTTWFDLASLTKVLFTTPTIFRLAAQGQIALDHPLVVAVPDLRQCDQAAPERRLTFRQCLSHATHLPAVEPLYTYGQDPATLRALILQRAWPAGPAVYSDINFMLLGIAIERLTGRPLAGQPLPAGLSFHPDPAACAATEHCTWRGRVLRGEVHDENAFSLGGAAGHAGLFGTIDGALDAAQALLQDTEPALACVRQRQAANRTLGWEARQDGWSGGTVCSEHTVGHTGFTDTGLWLDFDRGVAWACLARNRFSAMPDERNLVECKLVREARSGMPKTPSRVKFALMGCGRIGRMHAAGLAGHPRAELASVFDVSDEAASRTAADLGVRKAVSVEAVLADPKIEAILIATPTTTHVDLMIAAARAGKAILCEKPIDLDMEQVRFCAHEIAPYGVPIMIGFNRRFDPSFRAIRDRVQAGEIGTVEQIIITSRDPEPPAPHFIATSGGLFHDMSIHDFDMARYLVGDIAEVHAFGAALFDRNVAEARDIDSAVISLRARSGTLVQINTTRRCVYGYDQRLEVFGSGGMLLAGNRTATSVQASTAQYTGAADPVLHTFIQRYSEAYAAEVDHFVTCLRDHVAPMPDFADGVV